MEVYAHVSPSLHPNTIPSLPGYNEEIAPYLAEAMEALDTAYQGIDAIHKARQGAASTPTLNDAGKLLVVAEFAEKRQLTICKKFDAAMSNLKKSIGSIEDMLNAPMEQRSSAGGLTAEIRAHVKSLPESERSKFLGAAARDGDYQTLSAVLGAPAFLSGISKEEQVLRTRQYHDQKAPEAVQRLEVTKAAYAMLGRVGGLVHTQIEKAMGSTWSKVNNVRTAKQRAEAPFK